MGKKHTPIKSEKEKYIYGKYHWLPSEIQGVWV